MGLKQDLIDAKIEGLKLSGANDEAILKSQDALETQCELEKEAIVNFLTQCEFRVTKLNAPVVLEDFKIPPQQGDVLTTVESIGVGNNGAPVNSNVIKGKDGVITKEVDVNKQPINRIHTGMLQSTGYVYIGQDPNSQDGFDVEGEDGQREYTTVKLIRDDIEDLL